MKPMNEMPVIPHRKRLAQVGTGRSRPTTVAHTSTLVIQTVGRSGVERTRSTSSSCQAAFLACLAMNCSLRVREIEKSLPPLVHRDRGLSLFVALAKRKRITSVDQAAQAQ